MTPVTFTVPGCPVPLDRARHGNGTVHDTARNKAAKRAIALQARAAMRGRDCIEGPVKLRVVCWRRRAPHAVPDVSNYLKLVEDALNGIVYRDDAQIVTALAAKREAATDADERTVIIVSELEAAR